MTSGADHEAEALARYEEAQERRVAIKELWELEGSPLLSFGSQGQTIEHPLVKMLRDHDLLVQKLAVDIKKAHRGPVPSAVLRPSPAARLKEQRERRDKG
jgi:hypothetical protein